MRWYTLDDEEVIKMSKTAAEREATMRYDAKTYKKVNIALRYDEDSDILDSLRRAMDKGMKSREWLRELFENQK